ncbi:hypothetical protein QTP86_004361 [Hemibagrus guttatus]|nr:hypothetical protein QTP86_004361 [Hemibagrus guttatus]
MLRSKEIQKQMRTKVIEIYQSGKCYKAISKALGLPRTTVRAIIYKWRKRGTVKNLPRSGWPTKITPRAQRQLIQEVTKDPTTTFKELQASLASVKESFPLDFGVWLWGFAHSATRPLVRSEIDFRDIVMLGHAWIPYPYSTQLCALNFVAAKEPHMGVTVR